MKNFDYNDLIVLHEDNHIIVVLKPVNVPSQGDESGDTDLYAAVKEYIRNKYDKPGEVYLGLVHRLDRPTGGVMVFAKTGKAAARLSEAIREGETDKYYFAVVCGVPREKSGKLVHYLKKNPLSNIVTRVPSSTEGAKRAELDYKVLEEVQGCALVRIKLITGRSHQARVQMASLGTPIYGDVKYGTDPRSKGANLALWAVELKFNHPVTKQIMTFRAYPPLENMPWKAFKIDMHMSLTVSE